MRIPSLLCFLILITFTLSSAVYVFHSHSFSIGTTQGERIKQKSFKNKKTSSFWIWVGILHDRLLANKNTYSIGSLYSNMKGWYAEWQLQSSHIATDGLVVSTQGFTRNEFLPQLPTMYNF